MLGSIRETFTTTVTIRTTITVVTRMITPAIIPMITMIPRPMRRQPNLQTMTR